jgi:hypothetical protein
MQQMMAIRVGTQIFWLSESNWKRADLSNFNAQDVPETIEIFETLGGVTADHTFSGIDAINVWQKVLRFVIAVETE